MYTCLEEPGCPERKGPILELKMATEILPQDDFLLRHPYLPGQTGPFDFAASFSTGPSRVCIRQVDQEKATNLTDQTTVAMKVPDRQVAVCAFRDIDLATGLTIPVVARLYRPARSGLLVGHGTRLLL